MTKRVKCTECENMILPQTAAANEGLCAQCVNIPPEQRAEKREYERQLAEGLVFTPSVSERASSATPGELAAASWELQPEYYDQSESQSATDALRAAKTESNGNVFLVSGDGGELNLGFTRRHGVCEYRMQARGEFRYAFTASNLREQVTEEEHVEQACPCCGVGMLWYPSRYHMPRDRAFALLQDAISRSESPDVEWLEMDDFSYTQRGRG